MKRTRVVVLLSIAFAVVAIAPLLAALYFVDNALGTSLNLGFNPQVVAVLDENARNLKTLARFDQENSARYRTQFEQLQELRAVYGAPDVIKETLRRSLTVYFAIGTVAALLVALTVATLLGRRISSSYRAAFDTVAKNRERIRYLEEISSWQELAKMLAHEIKNPLTPIEVLVTSLSKSYLAKPEGQFLAQLKQTEVMINEELAHLKNTVNRFSEFARLPAVALQEADLVDVLNQQIKALGPFFENATIVLETAETGPLLARIDKTLLRQVLTNIIKNGIEANAGRCVNFRIRLTGAEHALRIAVSNDGEPVAPEIAPRMFDPYVSSQRSKENMGLGLAIARKIVLEHQGDIDYEEIEGQPVFFITLPRSN